MKHIILVMSDQHNGHDTSFENPIIATPNLERIAKEGRRYPHAYCNAPLCVPSRMSFLAGGYPSELSIFNNDTTLPVDMPTLAHTLGAAGYRTVLIGRMHFKGEEQHHGFDERYVGDITSQYWGTGGKQRTDFGAYAQSTNRLHCLQAVGAGTSPVMVYDELVFEEAMHFLSQPQSQPLFLVIGFYGPHFPYACAQFLYDKYKKVVSAPQALQADPHYAAYVQEADDELIRDCKASYYGLIETLDGYVGEIYDQVKQFSDPTCFLYTSDHGEQCGKRHIFGKQTLYEDAIHIPLVLAGDGIAQGIDEQTVDLLDVGKTILELADCSDDVRGESILGRKTQPWIRCETIIEDQQEPIFGQCVIRWPYKAVYLGKQVQLFDLSKDPQEETDIAEQFPQLMAELSHFVNEETQAHLLAKERSMRKRHEKLKAWGIKKKPKEPASVRMPKDVLQGPKRSGGNYNGI